MNEKFNPEPINVSESTINEKESLDLDPDFNEGEQIFEDEDVYQAEIDESGLTEDQIASEITNHEGQPAFDRGLYEQVVQKLTTNMMENTFYVKQEEIKAETIDILEEMAQNDPEFLAKALIYAREEGMLQLLPTYGLTVLSKAEDKSFFKKIFPRIITTPDNLMKFTEICRSSEVRQGFGGVATKAVKEWLENLNEYQAIKYSGDSPSKTKDGKVVKNKFSLRDLIIMARPKPENEEESERFNWLVSRHHDESKLTHNQRIATYEALKKATTDEERVELIQEGGLPWEVVIPSVPKMSPEIWQALMIQMPYMALLRNINNLNKNGIFEDETNVQYVVSRLTDEEAIEKAKILPFRFFEAYKAYTGKKSRQKNADYLSWGEDEIDSEEEEPKEILTDSRIEKALEEALELSFVNMPDINGTVAIGSDVSGSMCSTISDKGKTRFIDICGVFTGAILKKITDRAIPIPFDTKPLDLNLSGEDRILTTTNKLSEARGGGTAVGAPIQKLIDTNTSVDHFIGITDNEDWASGNEYYSKGSFLKNWRLYREKINPEARAYLITIAPYKEVMAPKDEPGVFYIYGWSDKVPGLISRLANNEESQVEKINNIEL